MEIWGDLHFWKCRIAELDLKVYGGGPIQIRFYNCEIANARIEVHGQASVKVSESVYGTLETVTWADISPDATVEIDIYKSRLTNFEHQTHHGFESSLKSAKFGYSKLGELGGSPFHIVKGMDLTGCRLFGDFVISLLLPVTKHEIVFSSCHFLGNVDLNYYPIKAVGCVFAGRIQAIDFSKVILDGSTFQNANLVGARWGRRCVVKAEREDLEWEEQVYRQLKGICANQGELDISAELHLQAMRTMRRRVCRRIRRDVGSIRREIRQYIKGPAVGLRTAPDAGPDLSEGWEKIEEGHFVLKAHPVKLGKTLLPNIFGDVVWNFQLSLQDIIYGFGVRPSRLVAWTLFLIVGAALLNWTLIWAGLGSVREGQTLVPTDGLSTFWSLLYFSGVTVTTLGYGDFVPTGWIRIVAVGEALCGAFLMALFVVTFVRKYGT